MSSYDEALTGTLECSKLSKAFFSKENMQIIQNSIRATFTNSQITNM